MKKYHCMDGQQLDHSKQHTNPLLPEVASRKVYYLSSSRRPCGCSGCCCCPPPICPTPWAPVICFPAPGDVTGILPTVSGVAGPNYTVTVCVDEICQSVIAGPDGQWSLQINIPLEAGEHTISVTQTNHCGETGPATDVTFTADSCYDVPAPEAPVILSPAYGEILDTPLVLIQGKAEPNASIRICFEDDCYNVTADDLGVWMFQLTSPLEDGTYQISATQTNECGKTSPPTKSVFTIVIPVCPTPPVPNITAPAPEETVYDMQPFILGSAEPGNTVTVCVDSICVVTVADENGEWSVQSPQELAIGSHMVTAHQENECGASSLTVEQLFSVAVPVNELAITELVRGQTFRTVDVTLEIGQMSGPWTVYYLLLDPELPAPTEAQVIRYNDPVTLTTGQAARGVFLQPQQGNVTLMRVLPGREVPSPLPGETGVMDGQRYILYMVGVVSTGVTTGQVYSAVTAIGMPFDSGEGTPAQPFIVRELTGEDLTGYPDLNSSHPANRAGVNETARQLDNIEGMRVLYDQNKQNGILNSLALFYELQSDFDLENYAGALMVVCK